MQGSFLLFLTAGILSATVSGIAGYCIGLSKDRGAEGLALGLISGPLGWIVTTLLPYGGQRCPACGDGVPELARTCKYCGNDIVEEKIDRIKTFLASHDHETDPYSFDLRHEFDRPNLYVRFASDEKTLTRNYPMHWSAEKIGRYIIQMEDVTDQVNT